MPDNYDTTTKFKVDISELKKEMQDAKRQVALANSEFKAASSSMDNWTKSTDGLGAKLKQLDSKLGSQKTVLSSLEKQYELTVAQMGEGSKEAENLEIAINNQKSVINQTEKEINGYKDSLEKVTKAEEIAAETGKSVDEVLEDLSKEAKNAGESAEKSSGGFTVMKGALADLVSEGIQKAISALKDFAKESIQTGIDFEANMSEVAAISGATGDQFELLEKTAKEYGATTVFSASEAAQALKYMALAGWDAEKSASALGGILDLAASSGMDLAKASDMVTDYLSAFGLEADKSTYFADMLAFAQSNANTSAEQLGEAFKNSAANMKSAGQDVETVTALLSMMANQGFKGSEAGTALTAMMRDLTAKMKDGKIAIGDTSVTVQDAQGDYRDLTDILKDVEKATYGMGDAEKATALSATFTADSIKGLNLLLNAGIDEAANFEEALRESGGTAAKMGETMNDNVAGDIKALESAMEGVKIEIYKELQPEIRAFVKYLTKDGVKGVKNITSKIVELGKKALPIVKKALEAVGKILEFTIDHFEGLTKAVVIGVGVFKTFKAAMAISSTITAFRSAVAASTVAVNAAQKAQLLWNVALEANPIGLVISAIALLVTGITLLAGSTEEATEKQDLLNESQRATVDAATEAAEAYRETKSAADEMAAAEMANIDYTSQLWKELQTLADENGKVKDGYEGRAEFILNQLNEALGTEYEMNGNIIQSYQDIKKSIEDVIEAKKAQILLEVYEQSYTEAINNVKEAERARGDQALELAKQQDLLTEAEQKYQDKLNENPALHAMVQDLYKQDLENLKENVEKEKQALDEKEAAYNATDSALKDYYNNIDAYETASALVMQGKTEEAIGYLNNLGSGFQTASSTAKLAADEQKQILEEQVVNTEINLKLMEDEYKENQDNMTEEQKRQAEIRIESARQEAENAKEEFVKVGGNLVRGMAWGAEEEGYFLNQKLTELVKSGLEAAKKAADIHSPSRLFKREVGKFIGLGIGAGIDDSTKDVVKSVKDQIKDIKGAYGTVATQLNLGGSRGGVTGNGGVVNNYNQTINSPKPLSRLEIYRQSKNLLGYVGGV